MISVIQPSRARPTISFQNCKKWLSKAGAPVQWIVSVDLDDPYQNQYREWALKFLFDPDYNNKYHNMSMCFGDSSCAVHAINYATRYVTGDILMVVSDDTDCPDNWAVLLEKAVEGKTDWIAKCPDGIQDWIITMPVMDRVYYERFGYIYHPDYRHMFCDTELSCVADLTGRRINLDIKFPHLHYSVGGMQKDEVSARADATWQQGEELFLSRAKNNFGLIDPPGKITSEQYLQWIKQKTI